MFQDLGKKIAKESRSKGVAIIDNSVNEPMKVDIESNLSEMENKLIFEQIESLEKLQRNMVIQRKKRQKKFKKDNKLKNETEEWRNIKLLNMHLEQELVLESKKIQEMLKCMKISKMEQILPVYEDLSKDFNHIDNVILEYKTDLHKLRMETEVLRRKFYRKT